MGSHREGVFCQVQNPCQQRNWHLRASAAGIGTSSWRQLVPMQERLPAAGLVAVAGRVAAGERSSDPRTSAVADRNRMRRKLDMLDAQGHMLIHPQPYINSAISMVVSFIRSSVA